MEWKINDKKPTGEVLIWLYEEEEAVLAIYDDGVWLAENYSVADELVTHWLEIEPPNDNPPHWL